MLGAVSVEWCAVSPLMSTLRVAILQLAITKVVVGHDSGTNRGVVKVLCRPIIRSVLCGAPLKTLRSIKFDISVNCAARRTRSTHLSSGEHRDRSSAAVQHCWQLAVRALPGERLN